jgi:hypothetical protein
MRIRKNQSAVTALLEGELGFKVNSGPLYNQLLKNDAWNALAKRLCYYRFGRETFAIYDFTNCCRSASILGKMTAWTGSTSC